MSSKIKILLHFPVDIWQMFISYLPGAIGVKLRYNYWKKRLKFLGKGVKLDVGTYLQNPQFISIDDNCWIDRNVIIIAGPPGSKRTTYLKTNHEFKENFGEVHIGKNTHVAPNCVLSGIGGLYIGRNCGIASNSTIYSFSHHYRNLIDKEDLSQYSFTPLARLDQQAMILGPVVIEDYCAVGLNSTLLPGTLLKKGTWVSSGSVISGEYPEQTLVFSNQGMSEKRLSNLKIKE
jgi:acetyltransferase-like isoleucine patch superfamily enzyme